MLIRETVVRHLLNGNNLVTLPIIAGNNLALRTKLEEHNGKLGIVEWPLMYEADSYSSSL